MFIKTCNLLLLILFVSISSLTTVNATSRTVEEVSTLTELQAAIKKDSIHEIKLLKDIEVEVDFTKPPYSNPSYGHISINRPLTINGNNKTINRNNKTIKGNSIQDGKKIHHLISIHNTTEVIITDLTLTGGDVGIQIDNSDVTLKNVNLIENLIGGIQIGGIFIGDTEIEDYDSQLDIKSNVVFKNTYPNVPMIFANHYTPFMDYKISGIDLMYKVVELSGSKLGVHFTPYVLSPEHHLEEVNKIYEKMNTVSLDNYEFVYDHDAFIYTITSDIDFTEVKDYILPIQQFIEDGEVFRMGPELFIPHPIMDQTEQFIEFYLSSIIDDHLDFTLLLDRKIPFSIEREIDGYIREIPFHIVFEKTITDTEEPVVPEIPDLPDETDSIPLVPILPGEIDKDTIPLVPILPGDVEKDTVPLVPIVPIEDDKDMTPLVPSKPKDDDSTPEPEVEIDSKDPSIEVEESTTEDNNRPVDTGLRNSTSFYVIVIAGMFVVLSKLTRKYE